MSGRRGQSGSQPQQRSGGRGQPRRSAGGDSRGRGGQQRSAREDAPRDTEADNRKYRERYLDALQAMTGQHVELVLKDKTKLQGIFHTVSDVNSSSFQFVLKGTKKQDGGDKRSGYVTVLVHSDQVLQVSVPSIVLRENVTAGSFATDTAISGKSASHLVNRELQQVDGSWLTAELTDGGLSGPAPSRGGKWDQFEANERITGRSATFDESVYTTKLDPTKISTDMLEKAVKLAKEIEDQDVHDGNIHMAEERGKAVDTGKYDEEDLYSGVIRTPAAPGGAAESSSAKPKAGEQKKDDKAKKPAFKFNPNAKPFSFNPAAKEFKPSFLSKKSPAPPPAAPAMPPQAVTYPTAVAAYPPRGPPGSFEGMQYMAPMGYPMSAYPMHSQLHYYPPNAVMPTPGFAAGGGGGQFVGEYPMGGVQQHKQQPPQPGGGAGAGGEGGGGSHTKPTENAS